MNMTSPDLYTRIVSAKLFMDEHFEQAMDLGMIARKACMSKFHFHRLFKSVYKKTPHAYVTLLRLERARQLLQSGTVRVGAVCHQVGFESPASFSLLFKRQYGTPPQCFRRMSVLKNKRALDQPALFIPRCFVNTYALTCLEKQDTVA